MKKMFISVVALAVSMMAMATESAYVRIRLAGASGLSSVVRLTEDDERNSSFEDGYDTDKMMMLSNPRSVLLYGLVGTHNCEDVKTNDLRNLALGFTTNDKIDLNYTITFENVSGRELKLYDMVTGDITVIAGANSYDFSITEEQKAAGNVQILDRFVIDYTRVVDAGDLEICHKDNQLQLLNNPYAENIVIKDAEGTTVKNVVSRNTPQYIDLSDLAAGQYTVELNNGNRSFIIKK